MQEDKKNKIQIKGACSCHPRNICVCVHGPFRYKKWKVQILQEFDTKSNLTMNSESLSRQILQATTLELRS
ncbi:hypothetical protein Hanom_Chr13g01238291 [Helianthus anomalus]